MKLGLALAERGPEAALPLDMIFEAERLGYDSVWTSESWGHDAVSLLAFIAAKTHRIRLGTNLLQIPARPPTLAANTMTTLDKLSGGRVMVGIGLSGPQVIEGWYGMPSSSPARRLREYLQVMRSVWARESPLEFAGREYQYPYVGEGASGLGKPLRSILRSRQLPIYVGAIGPINIRQTAELCEGWLCSRFSPRKPEMWRPHVEEGFRRAGGGKSFDDFDVVVATHVIIGDDVRACLQQMKPALGRVIGGYGAQTRNYYNQQVRALGYPEAAQRIQELFLAGRREEAIEAVPDDLCDEISLCGPPARIRQRFREWEQAGVTTMTFFADQTRLDALRLMAEISGADRGATR